MLHASTHTAPHPDAGPGTDHDKEARTPMHRRTPVGLAATAAHGVPTLGGAAITADPDVRPRATVGPADHA